MLRRNVLFMLIGLLVLTVLPDPAAAAVPSDPAASPTGRLEPLTIGDAGASVRTLQTLLVALGFYPSAGVNGVFDEQTADALRALQQAYGLPVTGALDPPTLRLLGEGDLHLSPRFRYIVRKGDRLAAIARRFRSKTPWIVRFNPHLTSVHVVAEGDELVIPIDFPLPPGVSAGRMQVLRDRFLGSYTTEVTFADAEELVQQQLNALQERGFAATLDRGSVEYGITLRGNGVVLGRMVFTPAESGTATQIDIGLLFSEDQHYEDGLLAVP